VGALKVLAILGFWGFLTFVLIASIMVGLGRQGWYEIRHEIRRRKSL
jgi:hypothetical protein